MRRKAFWLSRAAGGAVAGVLIAGAGFGIAEAGATGSSDQYTPGAKPYAGVQPHAVTVGTQTFPSSVTTTIANTTVTQPYTVTVPYTQTKTETETETVNNPADLEALAGAVVVLRDDDATILAFLKDDLRKLLEPSGNYLKTATLAKAKTVSFAFLSPGSGKLLVTWKASVKGKKGVDYVNYSGKLTKLADITVKLPTTAAGRKLLKGAKNGAVTATVTYTAATGGSLKVTRTYKLIG
jgi:hypothetical protein